MRIALLAAVLTAFATSVGVADPPTDHRFKLGIAYPGITFTPDREDVAMTNPGAPGNGLLLVFLGGIGDAPGIYGRLLRSAVEDGGYHSLGLDWVSGFETNARGTNIFYPCGDDDACFGAAWQQEFDGISRAPKVRIGPTDSVLNRLIKALSYLDRTYPDEGWGTFLASGQPVWSRIVLAGHSNGAGEAAYIASRIAVARVALFSGPLDSTGQAPNLAAASWMTGTLATPASLWYAFGSEHDASRTLNRTERYLVTWPSLGLGRPLRIDGMVPPFNDAHALTTNLAACDGCTAQDMTATDKTPLDADGYPMFRPVWDYMLGSSIVPQRK
jgi:hypothetical protein